MLILSRLFHGYTVVACLYCHRVEIHFLFQDFSTFSLNCSLLNVTLPTSGHVHNTPLTPLYARLRAACRSINPVLRTHTGVRNIKATHAQCIAVTIKTIKIALYYNYEA